MTVLIPGQIVLYNGWRAVVCEVNGEEITLYTNHRVVKTTDLNAIRTDKTEDVFEHP